MFKICTYALCSDMYMHIDSMLMCENFHSPKRPSNGLCSFPLPLGWHPSRVGWVRDSLGRKFGLHTWNAPDTHSPSLQMPQRLRRVHHRQVAVRPQWVGGLVLLLCAQYCLDHSPQRHGPLCLHCQRPLLLVCPLCPSYDVVEENLNFSPKGFQCHVCSYH